MPDDGTTIPEETAPVPVKTTPKTRIAYSRLKRKILSHVTTVRVFIFGAVLLMLIAIGYFTVKLFNSINVPLYFNSAFNFITAPIGQLAQYNGRTNILVMGKAGGVHEGPDLTDTMMLVSVSLNLNDVKIISIPRDTWIPDIRAKINSAYYWGIQKNVGGISFAKAEASQVVGVPIQYGAVIDFSGFKDVIDEMGGIEVNVENSFTDYYYPVAGKENDDCGGHDPRFMCRYETLTFNAGAQTMDGTMALKFVRSRHAAGIEGTDIAREARQAKIINALKNKLSDRNTYINPGKDLAILRVVLHSVETDLDYPTAAIIARRVYDSKDSISSFIIPEDLLVNIQSSRLYDMQSVFIPKAGNGKWQDINSWVNDTLTTKGALRDP